MKNFLYRKVFAWFLKAWSWIHVPLLSFLTKESALGLYKWDISENSQLLYYQGPRKWKVLSVPHFVLIFQLNLPWILPVIKQLPCFHFVISEIHLGCEQGDIKQEITNIVPKISERNLVEKPLNMSWFMSFQTMFLNSWETKPHICSSV